MQSNMEDADASYGHERLKFFNIHQPFTMSIEEFEIKWKTIDNIWVQFGGKKILKKDHGWTKNFDCRFKKRRDSSTKEPDIPAEKR